MLKKLCQNFQIKWPCTSYSGYQEVHLRQKKHLEEEV